MLVAAVVALLWANSPWKAGYEALFETHLEVALGDLAHIDLSLRDWINDALMAIFFLVVGLEIKRELVLGELRDPRAAALPAIAALGGMVVPALLYLAFNAGGDGSRGWGIPMAADIAFAAGVVSLLGRRVPSAAKLFLLTLAIVDDLGAIIVIAVFYTDDLSLGWLALAVGTVGAGAWLKQVHVRSLLPYVVLGAFCWFALHESGVHATLAGVAFGLLCPAWSWHDPKRFAPQARELVRLAQETESPIDRAAHALAPWVSFGIVPLFALANAGVDLGGGAELGSIALGVAVGLVVGKTVGVFGLTWLAVKAGMGRMPTGATWSTMFGIAMCAGIGFTVALFLAGLSFDDPALHDEAKIGILAASAVAGVARGYG